ncbi:MAG TPA: SH3 domain-containing protein [Patescibacteria group bacterium]|nr:SH3 domain-containing protein [Patescibacteria group bacterium]
MQKILKGIIICLVFGVVLGIFSITTVHATGYQACLENSSCVVGEFLYNDSYAPMTGASCSITSNYPGGTSFLSAVQMTAGANGWYSYSFSTAGDPDGLYPTQVCCDTTDTPSQHLCIDKSFTIEPANLSSSQVENAVWEASTSAHTNAGTFGSTAQNVSTLSAQQVWQYPTRDLTDFGSLIHDIWNYTGRSLDTFDNLVTGVWGYGSRLLTGATLTGAGNGQLSTQSDVTSAVSSIKGVNNKDLTSVSNDVGNVQTSVNTLSSQITTTQASVSAMSTNVNTLITKWGSYSASDILTQVGGIATSLGTSSDLCTGSTVFASIQCIKDNWGTQTAASLYTAANNAYTTASALQTELGYNGKTSSAYVDMQTLLTNLTAVNTSIGTVSDSTASATLFGSMNKTQQSVAGIQITANTILTNVNALQTSVNTISTNVNTLLSKWSTYSISDIATQISALSTTLGSTGDSCGINSTVFGSIQCVQNKWGSQTADTLYAAANNATNDISSISAELNFNGKSTTAYDELENLKSSMSNLSLAIGSSNDPATAATIFGRIQQMQNTLATLNSSSASISSILANWQSYSSTQIYNAIQSVSTQITNLNLSGSGSGSGGGTTIVNNTNNYNNNYTTNNDSNNTTNNSGVTTDLSPIINLLNSNADNVTNLKNSVLQLQALISTTKQLVEKTSNKPIVTTWMEEGSIIFKTLIVNPVDAPTQTVPVKFYLPKEATAKDVIKMDSGLTLTYDPAQGASFVSGSVTLPPGGTKVYSVEVTDIWKITDSQISSLRTQANILFAPLKNTAYFAQGATLNADILASLDAAAQTQKEAQTPDERISAYRAALIDYNKAQSELSDLRTLLLASSGQNNNMMGVIGGVQTITTWGIILILVAGFVFLTLYMRMITLKGLSSSSTEKAKYKKKLPAVHFNFKFPRFYVSNKTLKFTAMGLSLVLLAMVSYFTVFVIVPDQSANNQSLQNIPNTSNLSPTSIQPTQTQEIMLNNPKDVLSASAEAHVIVKVPQGVKGINVRSAPNFGGKILTSITTDTKFIEASQTAQWVQIEINVKENGELYSKGWVNKQYLAH